MEDNDYLRLVSWYNDDRQEVCMKRKNVIYFDIDGTLYSHRFHDIPEMSKQTLWALKKQGYKIVCATSRCRSETIHLPSFFQTFPFDAEIYDGGALIMKQGTILHKQAVSFHEIQTIINWVSTYPVSFRYATYDHDYIHAPCEPAVLDQFFRLYLMMPEIKVYEQEEVFNILLYTSTQEQVDMIKQMMKDVAIIEHSANTLELTAKGVGKDRGVAYLNQYWGVTMDDCVCFGDGANDIAMLQAAGIGVAMGNSMQRVKDAADFVTKHIDDDGITYACQALHLL